MRQLLTESVFLGAIGGLVGLLIGYEGSQLLWSFRSSQVSPNLITPKLDATVFVFALILSLLTGFVLLRVYDVTGRRVGSREVGNGGPGTHAVRLAEWVPPGVYVVRLSQAGRSLSTRVSVVR